MKYKCYVHHVLLFITCSAPQCYLLILIYFKCCNTNVCIKIHWKLIFNIDNNVRDEMLLNVPVNKLKILILNIVISR